MNFNQVIGLSGTFETSMDITIFESKLTNLFWQMHSKTISNKKAILLLSVSEEIHKILFRLMHS